MQERWNLIEDMVVKPRNLEREVMNRDMAKPAHQRKVAIHYLYEQEPFRMRRKEFWPISMADYLMKKFIPESVCHEADGLILQPWVGERSHYIPNTCEEVLKWKYAHLNSVDFRLRLLPRGIALLLPPLALGLLIWGPFDGQQTLCQSPLFNKIVGSACMYKENHTFVSHKGAHKAMC